MCDIRVLETQYTKLSMDAERYQKIAESWAEDDVSFANSAKTTRPIRGIDRTTTRTDDDGEISSDDETRLAALEQDLLLRKTAAIDKYRGIDIRTKDDGDENNIGKVVDAEHKKNRRTKRMEWRYKVDWHNDEVSYLSLIHI